MFFSLAHQINQDFSNHYSLGRLVLNTDNGWQETMIDKCKFVYKGYIETMAWTPAVLVDIKDHQHQGNFLIFCFDPDTDTITLHTNRWRGFLIWYDAEIFVSNLHRASYTIWNDSTVSIDQDLVVYESKIDIIGDTDVVTRDRASVEHDIDTILQGRVNNFLTHNSLPIKVFCSGGVDSTLVWSYIKRSTDRFELVLENRIQWDYFWCRNGRHIQNNFWGYKQIHHWLEPCVLTSGAPGDEFMLRSPTTCNLWCMYNDIDIFDLLAQGHSLHHDYFLKERHQQLFRQQHLDPSLDAVMRLSWKDFVWYLCNIVVNDCQHWHLGNTLTFTPLRDLEIFKLTLSLPADDIKAQILNSDVSLSLIANNDAALLAMLSDTKNVGESLSNMAELMPQ
jgi:hypothetical protein